MTICNYWEAIWSPENHHNINASWINTETEQFTGMGPMSYNKLTIAEVKT